MKPEIQEMIKVLQAYEVGKKIQFRARRLDSGWIDCDVMPEWNWGSTAYRVKPEPREVFVNIYSESICGHLSEQEARTGAGHDALDVAVRFREVLD